jgi:hypothetical protein
LFKRSKASGRERKGVRGKQENCQIVLQLIFRKLKGDVKSMTIKFSEFLTQKQIDGMYLLTIRNEVRREDIRRLLKGVAKLV